MDLTGKYSSVPCFRRQADHRSQNTENVSTWGKMPRNERPRTLSPSSRILEAAQEDVKPGPSAETEASRGKHLFLELKDARLLRRFRGIRKASCSSDETSSRSMASGVSAQDQSETERIATVLSDWLPSKQDSSWNEGTVVKDWSGSVSTKICSAVKSAFRWGRSKPNQMSADSASPPSRPPRTQWVNGRPVRSQDVLSANKDLPSESTTRWGKLFGKKTRGTKPALPSMTDSNGRLLPGWQAVADASARAALGLTPSSSHLASPPSGELRTSSSGRLNAKGDAEALFRAQEIWSARTG